jgi:hypothetical protein
VRDTDKTIYTKASHWRRVRTSRGRGEDQHTGAFMSVQKGADRVTFFSLLRLRLITCVALSTLTTKSKPCLQGRSFPRAAKG